MLLAKMQKVRANPIERLQSLSRERRRLLLRAAWMLSAASAAVALLPFRRAIRFGSAPDNGRLRLSIDECIWAVEAAARRLPWRTKCIEKGLTAQRLLRRGGVDARLHYGVRHQPETGKLEAHVWVTVGGNPVIGGDEATGFAEVARYP
jgi:hypothetical protein